MNKKFLLKINIKCKLILVDLLALRGSLVLYVTAIFGISSIRLAKSTSNSKNYIIINIKFVFMYNIIIKRLIDK